jgi:hypothetical protein
VNPPTYVSSVSGKLVSRYGSVGFIGARALPDGPVWDTRQIIAIPAVEMERFSREYARAFREHALRKRTAAEWEAFIAPPKTSGTLPPGGPGVVTEERETDGTGVQGQPIAAAADGTPAVLDTTTAPKTGANDGKA